MSHFIHNSSLCVWNEVLVTLWSLLQHYWIFGENSSVSYSQDFKSQNLMEFLLETVGRELETALLMAVVRVENILQSFTDRLIGWMNLIPEQTYINICSDFLNHILYLCYECVCQIRGMKNSFYDIMVHRGKLLID